MTARPAARQEGFTLVETALTCLLVLVVLAAAFPVVPVFFREANTVQNTYSAVDQLVLASEVVTRYVHEAVDPAPTATSYPFLSASGNAVTFYANTAQANGPEEVVVSVTNGAAGTRAFQANLYDPTANSCPFSTSSSKTCSYGSVTKSLLLINFLTNGTGGNPVFTYTLQGGSTCGGPPPSSGGSTLHSALAVNTSYSSISVVVASAITAGDTLVIGSGSSAQTVIAKNAYAVSGTAQTVQLQSSFTANQNYPANTTTVYDNVCSSTQLGQIQAVAVSLQATKNPGGLATGYQSLAYLLSPSYSATVG